MFYDKLIKICKEKNIKPSPVITELGLSSGNLKRWEKGAGVTLDVAKRFADYFNVPVEYFVSDEETSEEFIKASDEIDSLNIIFNGLKSNADHIASALTGKEISSETLSKISSYLSCSPEYLVSEKIVKETQDISNENISPKELILNILAKMAGTNEYRNMQVRISSIIISNLEKKNIYMDNLIEIGLSKNKIENLYNRSMPIEKKKGLNFSDLIRISEAFNLSYGFMLTGNGD